MVFDHSHARSIVPGHIVYIDTAAINRTYFSELETGRAWAGLVLL